MKQVVLQIPKASLALVEDVSPKKVYIFKCSGDSQSLSNYGIIVATGFEGNFYEDISFEMFTQRNHWCGNSTKRTLTQIIEYKIKSGFLVYEFDDMDEMFKFMVNRNNS